MLFWHKNNHEVGIALRFLEEKVKRKNIDKRFREDVPQQVCLNLLKAKKFHGRVHFNELSQDDYHDSEFYTKTDNPESKKPNIIDIERTDKKWKKRVKEETRLYKINSKRTILEAIQASDQVFIHKDDLKKVGTTAIKNETSNLARQAGDFRKAAKSDIDSTTNEVEKVGGAIQIYFTPYNTTDASSEDSDDKSVFLSANDLDTKEKERTFDEQIDIEQLYKELKKSVDEMLNPMKAKDFNKYQFLYTAYWYPDKVSTYKQLAKNVGFDHVHPAQVLQRFTQQLSQSLQAKNVNLSIELQPLETELFLTGELNTAGEK